MAEVPLWQRLIPMFFAFVGFYMFGKRLLVGIVFGETAFIFLLLVGGVNFERKLIMKKNLKIALIPGDGIGREVMPEGVRVLEAVSSKFGIKLDWTEFEWSCETYLQNWPNDA
ncbi:MAG: hypothetical protein CM1200mP30_19960 [Pseudomonadota bacterium]|nr:MAG: hypothetical protein CM1200mP30_19960 [Pseudomonadota bacterium]